MSFSITKTLSFAALSLSLALSAAAQFSPAPSLGGEREAMRMVPAQVILNEFLNADKTEKGHTFQATLVRKVQLTNGPALLKGTTLVGTVVTDDTNAAGTSRLAIRFTEAHLKDGTIVPIKATIVGAFQPELEDMEGNSVKPGNEVPNTWNDGTLEIDQLSIASGVDLHSKIASANSGVFVASKDKVVNLPAGTELALAIAFQAPHKLPTPTN